MSVTTGRYLEPAAGLVEQPLLGGDVTAGVVRVGDTVRRPLNEQSEAVHAYLRHLERRGFDAAPRILGIDARGREVLTYIAGEMGGRPLHPWAVRSDVLVAVAHLQRRLHDHSTNVRLPPGVAWRTPPQIAGFPPLFERPDVIAHNDMTPENIIFRAQAPIGIVDFDLAGPTTRLLDIVVALRWWAPLCDPVDRDRSLRDANAGSRMRAFVDAYGLGDAQRRQLLDLAGRRAERSWHVMRHRAVHDGGGWARMWDDGVGDVIRRTSTWLVEQHAHLQAALTD